MSLAATIGQRATAHWALWAVCALFLLAATLVIDDYGVSPDEAYQRAVGQAALDYLAGDGGRAFKQLSHFHDRYYGAVIEAPLALLERIPGLEDPRDISLGRNAFTHLFFLVGGVFCYLLVLRLFHSRPLALLAMILFLLHPRIYAHSFFNSKDVPFLTMFMISLYLAHRAFRRDTLGAFLLCGAGVGLLMNLRIMGVVLFAAVLALRALDLAFAGSVGERKRALLTGGGFALAAMLTYYASLPVLWTDPAGRFAELVQSLGSHPHQPLNLFRGEWLYSADGPPFDYVPVWVGITTPPATLLLALIGTVALAWRALRRPRHILRNGPLRFGLLLAALPAVTVVAVVVLENHVYEHWRQLYFLCAPLLLLAAFGLHGIMGFAGGRWPRMGAYALAGAAIVVALVSMARIHPHQNSYFTVLTDRTTPERLVSRYHMDTWKLSTRELLIDILDDHSPQDIQIANLSGIRMQSLSPNDRERLAVTNDFRSAERTFYGIPLGQSCRDPRLSGAAVYTLRLYASTLYCVVDAAAYFGDRRRAALAAEPLIRSVYDIYRDGRTLTYLRDRCPLDDIEEGWPRFFLHVVPVADKDLPPRRREYGFDNLNHYLRHHVARLDGNCVVVMRLPDYPIAVVRTGQFTGDGVLWEADIAFGEGAPDYAAVRREALAGEPLAHSVYDIHLAGRALTYLRDGCTDEKAEARFFLHVFPADEDDLPPHREQYGFDNLDFTLAARGARIGGDCVAVVPLPAYPIATIRTGQYDSTGALWTAEFAPADGE